MTFDDVTRVTTTGPHFFCGPVTFRFVTIHDVILCCLDARVSPDIRFSYVGTVFYYLIVAIKCCCYCTPFLMLSLSLMFSIINCNIFAAFCVCVLMRYMKI